LEQTIKLLKKSDFVKNLMKWKYSSQVQMVL
jgi:hypothetical protein